MILSAIEIEKIFNALISKEMGMYLLSEEDEDPERKNSFLQYADEYGEIKNKFRDKLSCDEGFYLVEKTNYEKLLLGVPLD